VLETVGVGAAAELVDGAAAGGVLGGASVAGLDGAGAGAAWLDGAGAVAWAAAWAPDGAPDWEVGWPSARVLADAVARARLWWVLAGEEADEARAEGDALAAGAGVVLLAVVWAGALRANKVAKPTAVTALSWVARQVRRDRRRSPAARAAPGCSWGNSDVSRMSRDPSSTRVKSS
jgi:hypothetical protein